VVGIKPTVGLTSRAGVIPISHTQDTVGPHARTVADAAAVLSALVGVDPRDPATAASAGHFSTDYTQFLDPDGLQGARIGVARGGGFTGYSAETDAIFELALEVMADAGAVLVDPAEIPTIDQLNADQAEIIVLIWEFKRDLNAYLATRTGVPVHNLADVIEFNLDHASQELQYFGQEFLELAQAEIFSEQEYNDALVRGRQLAATDGIDAILAAENLDALVAPTGSPAWPIDLVNGDHFLGASSGPAAIAGYPIINMPAGLSFGLPVGISFMGTAFSEPTLIKIASGFEAASGARRAPTYIPTVPLPRGIDPFTGKSTSAARVRSFRQRLEQLLPLRNRLRGLL
jgi:amidase